MFDGLGDPLGGTPAPTTTAAAEDDFGVSDDRFDGLDDSFTETPVATTAAARDDFGASDGMFDGLEDLFHIKSTAGPDPDATSPMDEDEKEDEDGEHQENKDSPSDESGDSSHSSDSTLSIAEKRRMDLVDVMKFVAGLMRKLGIASVAGYLHEGMQYEVLKTSARSLRALESSPLDGAWIMGAVDETLAALLYSERLHRLGLLVGEGAPAPDLSFHDSKASIGQTLNRELAAHRKRVAVVSAVQSEEQSAFASNLHINIHSIPGTVILSPPHSLEGGRMGFQDVMLHETHVSLVKVRSSVRACADLLIASSALHATRNSSASLH